MNMTVDSSVRNEAQNDAGPSPNGRRSAVVSLVLSGLGVLLTFGIVAPLASKELAAFFFPPWWRAFAIVVTFGLLAAGFVAAIWSLVAARRMIHGALAVSIAGGVIWTVSIAVVTYFSFGYQLSAGDLYSEQLADSPTTRAAPLPYGTEVELRTLGTRNPAMLVAAGDPIDITQEAIAAGAPAPEDQYIAVPLTVRVIDAAEIDPDLLPDRRWDTESGYEAWPVEFSIAGYEALKGWDLNVEGEYSRYDVFDADWSSAEDSRYTWLLPARGQRIYWGAGIEEFIPEADRATYGSWVDLTSTVTGENAARIRVDRPVDVTDAADAASVPRPANGAFFACHVTVEVDRSALADPNTDFRFPDMIYTIPEGASVESPTFAADHVIPGYPTVKELASADSATTFEYDYVFEAPPSLGPDGSCVVMLAESESGVSYSIQFVP